MWIAARSVRLPVSKPVKLLHFEKMIPRSIIRAVSADPFSGLWPEARRRLGADMTLQSMTGFARVEGTSGRTRWAWELRSVNGKGLDLRLRLPPGLEALEADVRRLAGEAFSRGNIQIGLASSVSEAQIEAVVNQGALAAVMALRDQLAGTIDPAPLKLDTLLSVRGIVDFREAEESGTERTARDGDIRAG